jgi:hypothetical protein
MLMKLLSTKGQVLFGLVESAGAHGSDPSPATSKALEASVEALASACEGVGMADVAQGLRSLRAA